MNDLKHIRAYPTSAHSSKKIWGGWYKEVGFVSYRFIKGEPLSRNTLLKLNQTAQAHVISQLAIQWALAGMKYNDI